MSVLEYIALALGVVGLVPLGAMVLMLVGLCRLERAQKRAIRGRWDRMGRL